MTINLAKRRMKLQGWRPFYWQLRASLETGGVFAPEFGPFPAIIPGSVHTTLRREGILPDWNKGRASLACEWAEHRHWEFFTEFRSGELPADKAIVLEADGLDYSGWILVDTKIVATFRGALIRHRFDLTKYLGDGKPHRLSIIFDIPPEEQGQMGKTSLSRYFKPRYNFSWDWCVRLVPTGIWDRLELVCDPCPIEVISVTTSTREDLQSGEVVARLHNHGKSAKVKLILRAPDGKTARSVVVKVNRGEDTARLSVRKPQLWCPNGAGSPHLYEVEIYESPRGKSLFRSRIGFKHVRWLPCADAPPNARPLLCEINGHIIFLQGVNWTPAILDYPSTPASDYRRLVKLYARMGCNVLRVWGGGFLEKREFYQECDAAGILVWQEFPLSSSGPENDAPRDPKAVADLEAIATDYIRRRGHHASLLLWCGGNELQADGEHSVGHTKPLDETHPALAALQRVVERENPGVRFLPTSPSGPVFYANRDAMGKGIHHHVHGPWDRDATEESWQDYWSHDDALLRSETGVAGAANVDLLKRYCGDEQVWPPSFDNPWWRHGAAWWLQWDLFKAEVMRVPKSRRLALFVRLSQERQARFLALAAETCKKRFPQCAGFIVWMGHDAFPCPSNTSLIDFDRKPKPAYKALSKIFHSKIDSSARR